MKRINLVCGIIILVITIMVILSILYKKIEGMESCSTEHDAPEDDPSDYNPSEYDPSDYDRSDTNGTIPNYKINMNDYILKTNIIPPVCPVCPTVSGRDKPCPACPPCGRCPEQNFECKKVQTSINDMPISAPTFDDFGEF